MQIIRARCTKVDIRLILRLRGQKDSQRKYRPVKVGFRYTLVSKPISVFSTCALNYDNKRFAILATARSFFHLNLLEAAYITRPIARFYADRKSLLTLSNSFDTRGIWPPAVLSLTFAIAKSFFGALYKTSPIIGSS